MLDIKDYKKLQPYEPDLRRAYKADYKLPTPSSEDSVIQEILLKYDEFSYYRFPIDPERVTKLYST